MDHLQTVQQIFTARFLDASVLPSAEADKAVKPLLDALKEEQRLAREVVKLALEAQRARCEATVLVANLRRAGVPWPQIASRVSKALGVTNAREGRRLVKQRLEKRIQRGCGDVAMEKRNIPPVAPTCTASAASPGRAFC